MARCVTGGPRKVYARSMRVAVAILVLVAAVPALAGTAGIAPVETPEQRYARGAKYIEAGKLDQAETYFTALTNVAPDRPRYWWGLGFTLKARGRHGESIPCWQRTIALDGDAWRAREQLVQAYQQTGNRAARDEAIAALLAYRSIAAADAPVHESPFFCRERTTLNGHLLLGLQFFDGQSRLRFSVGTAEQGEERFFETRAVRFPDGDGAADLTAFCAINPGVDRCLGLYERSPGYDELREVVVRHLTGAERNPSTEDERRLFVRVVNDLGRQPFAKDAAVCRSWATGFIADVPDIVVSLNVDPLGELLDGKHPQEIVLVGQYLLAAGVEAIRRLPVAVSASELAERAFSSCLDTYEVVVARDATARRHFLDEALAARRDGTLSVWLARHLTAPPKKEP